MKHIVILGGSFAGISTAHRILKQATKTAAGPFKITLVSPNTHFYWTLATPRGVIPGVLSDDELFRPIAPGFKHYPAGQFEFILATAETLDVESKKIKISGSADKTTLDYDFLILATGTHSKGEFPFKGVGTTDATKDALHDFQARVKKAKTIVVAGAGPTGVETAAEMAFVYGKEKQIIQVASGPTVLDGTPAFVSNTAVKELQKLKVDLKLQTKVQGSTQLPNGQQELTLSGGEKLVTDMYIPTFGLVPNSSYVPTKFLDAKGYVLVDDYLRVKGLDSVWAIGDVSAQDPSQFIFCDKQSAYLAKNFTLILRNKAPLPYPVPTTRMMGLSIGRKMGVGHWGDWKMPTFLIVYVRKQLFLQNMAGTLDGSGLSGSLF